jgi:hypothetical protein
MLSNISDLFTMASLVICMLLSGIIFYYLRTRINMLEQSVMDQAQLLQQVVTSIKSSQFRQMGLQQQQQQQQQNKNDVEKCLAASLDNHDYSQSNSTIKLIQVSDDSDNDSNDDSDSDSDDDSDDDSYDNNDNNELYSSGNSNGGSKIIDLSAITSSSSMSFLPLTKSDDVKIIELKSNIKLNGDDESDQSDQSDESDESDDDNDESDQSDDDNDESDNDNDNDNNDNQDNETKQNNTVHETNKKRNNGNNGNNNRIFKSIVIEEDVTIEENSNILSLDKMKNMPVNTLRNLAKKKLNNVDTPTINKMSKKEILKAFHS